MSGSGTGEIVLRTYPNMIPMTSTDGAPHPGCASYARADLALVGDRAALDFTVAGLVPGAADARVIAATITLDDEIEGLVEIESSGDGHGVELAISYSASATSGDVHAALAAHLAGRPGLALRCMSGPSDPALVLNTDDAGSVTGTIGEDGTAEIHAWAPGRAAPRVLGPPLVLVVPVLRIGDVRLHELWYSDADDVAAIFDGGGGRWEIPPAGTSLGMP